MGFRDPQRGWFTVGVLVHPPDKAWGLHVWPKNPKSLQPSPFPKMGLSDPKRAALPRGLAVGSHQEFRELLRALSDPKNQLWSRQSPSRPTGLPKFTPKKSSSPIRERKAEEREGKSIFNGGRSSSGRPRARLGGSELGEERLLPDTAQHGHGAAAGAAAGLQGADEEKGDVGDLPRGPALQGRASKQLSNGKNPLGMESSP